MKIDNSFEVAVAPERAWDVLMDVPKVILCMPGAELTEVVDENAWKAKMTVKLGPVGLQFATDLKREQADEAGRSARLSAQARETRGRGAGQATIDTRLAAVDGGTRVDVVTDLRLSGKVAQYGRGMIEDVSSRLVGEFAACLQRQLEVEPAMADVAPAPAGAKPVGGLRLGLGAFFRALVRRFRRKPEDAPERP
jgi:carbon monoxide dehydrogenase subunit G